MKRYILVLEDGAQKEYAKKASAVSAGNMKGVPFKVISPSGLVVHETSETPPLPAEEPVEPPKSAKPSSVRFRGNYATTMANFALLLAGKEDLEVEITDPGSASGLDRVVVIKGSGAKDFAALLESLYAQALEALKAFQKENRETRRSMTDMERFVQNRSVLVGFGRGAAGSRKKDLEADWGPMKQDLDAVEFGQKSAKAALR